MYDIRKWQHVFKLDPNKEISDSNLTLVCESGTDAIIVGGTDGVTENNTLDLMARIRRFSVPCVLEVSNTDCIVPGFDFYFIPMVLNSEKREWIVGLHHEALKNLRGLINFHELVIEGYCILNEECKAAQVTKANTALNEEEVIAYAHLAEHLLRLPIFYMEYSGIYGDPALVSSVRAELTNTQLFYGGGIKSVAEALEMGAFTDTIVIGNLIYENIKEALYTVQAIKDLVGEK